MDIYKSSFPTNETRLPEKVVEMLENDKDYHLFISVINHSVVGISLIYIFRSLSIGLLDYIAVIPNQRGSGIGMELFKFTLERFSAFASSGIGLLMEIQKVDVPDPLESNIRKNRVRFYTKAGAKIFDGVNYILPTIHNGIKAEEMYLMIRPLKQIHYLAKESVVQYIGAIYSTIYQYQNNDLLDTISQKLPPSRDNREMLQKYQSRAKKVLMQTYVDVMEVTANDVAEEVLLTADKKNIDTIVVGSRGISEAKKFLLGSVSYKVSHYAKRPVVIVR